MTKLNKIRESMVLIGLLGFAGYALAHVDAPLEEPLPCNTEEIVCIQNGPDDSWQAYEAEINCYNIDVEEADSAQLWIGPFDGWEPPFAAMEVNQVTEEPPVDFHCNMFDAIEEMKTEGRCTNVTRGNGKSDPTPQADYEVKRKEAYDEDCPAGEHEHED